MSAIDKQFYWVWCAMIGRCTNPRNKQFEYYGGRGITVSDAWRKFENFSSDMGPRPPGLTLERRDNEKGYSKENCYWADRQAQNLNKRIYRNNKTGVRGIGIRDDGKFRVCIRRNKKIVFDLTIADFFEACCASHSAKNRLNEKMESLMPDDTYMTIAQLCRLWDVTPQTLRNYRAMDFGPKPIQLLPGRRGLRYLRSEVEAFDAERRRARGE